MLSTQSFFPIFTYNKISSKPAHKEQDIWMCAFASKSDPVSKKTATSKTASTKHGATYTYKPVLVLKSMPGNQALVAIVTRKPSGALAKHRFSFSSIRVINTDKLKTKVTSLSNKEYKEIKTRLLGYFV